MFGDERVNDFIDVLQKNSYPHQILSAEDVNKKYSEQLQLPNDYRCVIEESGGILQADTAVAALQVYIH